MRTLKIGIIGFAGMRGKELLRQFNHPEFGYTVTDAVDLRQDRFGDIQELYPEISMTTHWQAVCHSSVDAIAICSPDWLHEEHACAALKAGKHVFLEKPMAITPEGCKRIMDEARISKKIVYVGHNMRHFTVMRKIKELLDSKVIGDVKTIWCRHFVNYGGEAYFQDWHAKRENVGGLLIHKGCHDLDIIHWFGNSYTSYVVGLGAELLYKNNEKLDKEYQVASIAKQYPPPTQVQVHPQADVEDVTVVSGRLANGVITQYAQCHFAPISCREYSIIGTKGMIENSGDHPTTAVVNVFTNFKERSRFPTESFTFESEKGFHGDADQRIVQEFIEVIRGNSKSSISLQDAFEAIKTAYAATESLRNGSILVRV